MEYQSCVLANGLRVVHKNLNSHVSYCGFIINVGTRDEKDGEHGMAHFVEHMLFKGTKKRKSHHIINRMEHVGGEINAYTNKEETVIYSIFLEEHHPRAIELLSDLTFNSTFPEKEIKKEVEVIIDEIHSYEDSPSELIFDEFENLIFKGSSLGHNILGEADILKGFTTDKTKQFVDRFYSPQNMVFFYVGKTDLKKVVKQLNKNLEGIRSLSELPTRDKIFTIVPKGKTVEKDTSQTHALIGGIGYNLYHPKKKVLQLMNNILGGPGMNSRLNIALREKRGYVYNVESNLISYTDTGLFTIYFGCDNKNKDKCIDSIYKELDKLRKTKLTTSQLSLAKQQLIGQIGISTDNHENLALGMGKSYMRYNDIDSMTIICKKIEAISHSDILDVANEVFNEKNITCLFYEQSFKKNKNI